MLLMAACVQTTFNFQELLLPNKKKKESISIMLWFVSIIMDWTWIKTLFSFFCLLCRHIITRYSLVLIAYKRSEICVTVWYILALTRPHVSGYVVCNQGTAVFVQLSNKESIRSKLIQSLASTMHDFETDIGAWAATRKCFDHRFVCQIFSIY